MSQGVVVGVPDVLRGPATLAERFLSLMPAVRPNTQITLNLSDVGWICPYGAVILLGACRYLAQFSGQPVQVSNLQTDVHAYLRRIDFFVRAERTAYTLDSFDATNELGRGPASTNVLELVPIGQPKDVYDVGNQAAKILSYWLVDSTYDSDRVISLLAESCSNAVDHSGDVGVVTIQKYERSSYVDVELAISDSGIGIRRSLSAVHRNIPDTDSGCIEQALAGLSARKGRGGHGLRAIQQIATASGGSLLIRSETGSVMAKPAGTNAQDGLAFFPGTQVAITFRSLL